MCRVFSQTPENKKNIEAEKSFKMLLYENYRLSTRPIDSELCAPLDLLLAKIALDYLYISAYNFIIEYKTKLYWNFFLFELNSKKLK